MLPEHRSRVCKDVADRSVANSDSGSLLPLIAFLLASLWLSLYLIIGVSELTALRINANQVAHQIAVQSAGTAMFGSPACTAVHVPIGYQLQYCTDSGTEVSVGILLRKAWHSFRIKGEARVGYGFEAPRWLP